MKSRFKNDGVLYKAQSSGRFQYLGDDPGAYESAFTQETKKNGKEGLQPLIDLLRWESEADDAAFAAGLEQRVNVESFARYAAMQNLLLNFDDMSGPGQNYYLFYDLTEKKFTVVNWDLNLAFSGSATQGPFETRGGFGGRGGHRLKDRFLAAPRFRELYLAQYRTLHASLLANGRALEELARLERIVAASGLVARDVVAQEANALRSVLQQRTTYLAGELRAR